MRIETTRQTTPSENVARIVACLAVVLLLTPAQAQQTSRTIYDRHGHVESRTVTDSAGNVTIYDRFVKVTGRTSVGSDGTVTTYDASGRKTGSVTAPNTQQGK